MMVSIRATSRRRRRSLDGSPAFSLPFWNLRSQISRSSQLTSNFAPDDYRRAIHVVEDYKPLDIQSATMALALCEAIRQQYPDWRYLVDGDGGCFRRAIDLYHRDATLQERVDQGDRHGG